MRTLPTGGGGFFFAELLRGAGFGAGGAFPGVLPCRPTGELEADKTARMAKTAKSLARVIVPKLACILNERCFWFNELSCYHWVIY